MSEELNTESVTPETEAPARSDIEQRALDMGWRPKEEFDGSEDDFIDAKEFVRRKPLFEKIENQNKQIKAVTKALEEFKAHYSKVEETALKNALAQLKAERKQALSEGDGDRFEVLDDKIKSVETQVEKVKLAAESPIVQEESAAPAEFTRWVSKNSWYDNVSYMRKFADEVGVKFAPDVASGRMSPDEVLREVEKQVRKEFPHKFTNPNKASAPDVESSRPSSGKRDSFESQLSDQERKVMNDFVRNKIMTKEEYLADLKKIKEKK